MTRTGTQNRPYVEASYLPVVATFKTPGADPYQMKFNWDDRTSVRAFAAESDKVIRAGGSTTLENENK